MFRPSASVCTNENEIQLRYNENLVWVFKCMYVKVDQVCFQALCLPSCVKVLQDRTEVMEKIFCDSARST